MEQNLLPIVIAIMFSLGAIVIGKGISYGAVWLVEKIEEFFAKRKK